MALRIISHRGNLDGPNSCIENSPEAIEKALSNNFDVEIDLWKTPIGLFLGHDFPEFEIDQEFLSKLRLWIHCKTIPTFEYMLTYQGGLNFFYHTIEDCVLTSYGYIWTYPNDKLYLGKRSIAVLPEKAPNWDLNSVFGVCTDYPRRFLNDKAYSVGS